MAKYEFMYIVRANVEEAEMNAVKEDLLGALTANGATVLESKDYGLKDFAYEIEHMRKGYYVWFKAEANADACKEFTRRANINEKVLRHIIVKEEK